MKRFFVATAAAIIAATIAAVASQNPLSSPTTGTVSGLQVTNNYNNAVDSLNTANSGATAPTNQLSGAASLGNFWLNTSSAPYPLGMFDGTTRWPAIGSLDPTNHAWNMQIGGGVNTLASGSTVDLCSTSQNYLTISGTTTITSFGSTCPAGVVKLVTFSGALTLTYNASSLIIPGAANVSPTTAGDQATLVSLGSGNWQVASYTPANGGALINPSVDVGDMIMTFLTAPPSSKYMFSWGQAVSRATYSTLLTGITITQSVTRTNGSPTLTGFTDTTQIPTSAPIEGSGISIGATISSCTATTCTMSANASSSGTANVTIFPNGNGDGSTTFNLPNCQGTVLAGRPNMSGSARGNLSATYYGTNPNALAAYGGGDHQFLNALQIPTIAVSVSGSATISGTNFATGNGTNNFAISGGSGTTLVTGGNIFSSAAVSATGSSTNTGGGVPAAFSITQPTLTANCMIRVLAMNIDWPPMPSSNDNDQRWFDRRRAIG